MSRQFGFTLLELVLVMVLLSILGAVAVPRLTTQDYDQVFFKDTFINGLRFAQKKATATQLDVGIIRQNEAFVVLARDESGDFNQPIISPYGNERGKPFIIQIPQNINLSGPVSDIFFDGAGRAHYTLTNAVPGEDMQYTINDALIRIVGETGYIYEDRS